MLIRVFLASFIALTVGATPRIAWALGACCTGSLCNDTIRQSDCALQGKYFLGEGTFCEPDSCDTGACCERATPSNSNGSCDQAVTESECTNLCGKFVGRQTTCSNVPGGTCTSYFLNAPPLACDCNQNGEVKINELENAVLLLLCGGPGTCCVDGYYPGGGQPYVCTRTIVVPACPAADPNHNGVVAVNEIIQGVNAANGMCFQ